MRLKLSVVLTKNQKKQPWHRLQLTRKLRLKANFLKWPKKYVRKFMKGKWLLRIKSNATLSESMIYLLSNIMTAGVPFLLLPLLTKYLTPDQYGEVAMFQTMVGFFGAFVGLSCHLFVARKYYDFKSEVEKAALNGACFQVVFFTSFTLLIINIVFQDWLSKVFGLPASFLFLGVLVCAATAVVQIRLVCWQVRHTPKNYGFTQVGQALLNLSLSIILVVVLLMASNGRILAQSLSVLIIFLISVRLMYADNLVKLFPVAPQYIAEILKFGVPLIPHVLGIFLLVTVDRFVINSELGLGQTGIYMVGVQIAAGLSILFDGLNKAFLPWLYENLKKESPEVDRFIVRVVYVTFLAALAIGLILFYLLPAIIPYIIDEKYHAVSGFIGWLLIGQVMAGMYLIFANFIFYSKKTGWLSVVSVGCGVLNVFLLIILLEPLGIKGAAIAFFIAMALRALLAWCVAFYRCPMPWFGKFLYKKA